MWNRFFQLFGLALLVFSWVYPALHYSQLPDIVPIHFDLEGKADGFGSKNTVWMLCVVFTFMFLFIGYISRNLDSPLLNITQPLRRNKPLAELFVNVLLALTMMISAVGSYEFVQIGLGRMTGISHASMLIIILVFVVMAGFFIYAHFAEKRKTEIL